MLLLFQQYTSNVVSHIVRLVSAYLDAFRDVSMVGIVLCVLYLFLLANVFFLIRSVVMEGWSSCVDVWDNLTAWWFAWFAAMMALDTFFSFCKLSEGRARELYQTLYWSQIYWSCTWLWVVDTLHIAKMEIHINTPLYLMVDTYLFMDKLVFLVSFCKLPL